MSKFKRFSDFLTEKKEEGLAGLDYDGPLSIKPPQKPTKGKTTKPLPYKSVSTDIPGNVLVADGGKDNSKGLAYDSTPGMTPSTSSLGVSPVKKKLKTEEFVNLTKDMSTGELVSFINEVNSIDDSVCTLTDLHGNQFTPDPNQAINFVTGVVLANPNWMQSFVREMKRRGGIECLIEELLDHDECYDELVKALEKPEHGQNRCNKLAKHMNNSYSSMLKNFGMDDEMFFGDLGESIGPSLHDLIGPSAEEKLTQQKKSGKGIFGDESGGDTFSRKSNKGVFGDSGGDAFSKESGGNAFSKEPSGNMFSKEGGGNAFSKEPSGNMFSKEGGGNAFSKESSPTKNFDKKDVNLSKPKKMSSGKPKFKGTSAASTMIKEMKVYPHFLQMMVED